MPSIYPINKGVDNPIEFQGLKGQYLLYAVLLVLGLFLVSVILFILQAPALLVLPLSAGAGLWGIARLAQYSKKYGLYGLMKKAAQARLPKHIRYSSRVLFTTRLTSTDEKDR